MPALCTVALARGNAARSQSLNWLAYPGQLVRVPVHSRPPAPDVMLAPTAATRTRSPAGVR